MKLRLFAYVQGSLLLIIGCSGQQALKPSAMPVAAPKKEVQKSKEKTEVPSIFDRSGDEYSYNPVGKRDPFMIYAEETVTEDPSLPKSPLERYSLDQLKVTAIVWGISDPRALLQAPDNESYIVRKNMRVGKNRGRVSKITKRNLYVEEEYRDPTGKLVVNEQVLEIRPELKKPEGNVLRSDE